MQARGEKKLERKGLCEWELGIRSFPGWSD